MKTNVLPGLKEMPPDNTPQGLRRYLRIYVSRSGVEILWKPLLAEVWFIVNGQFTPTRRWSGYACRKFVRWPWRRRTASTICGEE